MIKPEDLRLGNHVFVENPIHHPKLMVVPLKVTSIEPRPYLDGSWTHSVSLEHIVEKENEYKESYSQFIRFIKPIPLTEEYILKFWFRLDHRSETGSGISFYHHTSAYYGVQLRDNIWYFRAGHTFIECKYIHKLQNAFYLFTGEELTLKK